jgi:glycine betaine/proline transport system substrate-binding protein
VHIAVHPSLSARAPEIIEFLRNWDFGAGEYVAVATWMSDNDATFEEAAIWYLTEKEAVWIPMLPADIGGKVLAALAKE